MQEDGRNSLTVAQCQAKLMELEELIVAHGPMARYTESLEFWKRQLDRCTRRRKQHHGEHFEQHSSQSAR
jgi:hypothetical protein